MSIRVECPSCRSKFSVADQHAGKRGRCPHCKEALTVPLNDDAVEILDDEPPAVNRLAAPPPAASAIPTARLLTAAERSKVEATPRKKAANQKSDELLQALQGSIEPVKPTALYRFWIFVVAGIMVLLPVIYLSLIGAVMAGVLWYAGHGLTVFNGAKNARGAIIVYFGPLIAGVALIAFMLKPLFARSGKRAEPVSLDPEKEVFLYQFVDGVCQTVGAPTPVRIDVDCQVNASAHIDGSLLALSNDLVLTIGLPLVLGLDLRQFTGVLAHEFGHFSQAAGMRLSGLIRWVNHWFARVVYERDSWDDTVASWMGSGTGYLVALSLIVRIAVWITRRILWVLMMFGHLVSGFLSRQMEFDADRYQTRMVGSETLASTMERIGVLATAQTGAFSDLSDIWRERRLPDNLPKLIVANVDQIPAEVLDKLKKDLEEGKTGLFDTHPADRERIVSAIKEDSEGIFQLSGPTTVLFRDFDSTSRMATYEHYRAIIGSEVKKEQLFPVEEAIRGSVISQQGNEAFERFFLPDFTVLRSLLVPAAFPPTPADLKAAKESVVLGRRTVEKNYKGYVQFFKQWDETHIQLVRVDAAATLIGAGGKVRPADFGLEKTTVRAAESALHETEAALERIRLGLVRYEQVMTKRLMDNLGLLGAQVVRERIEHGDAILEEARGLYPYVTFLHTRVLDEVAPVLRAHGVLAELLGMLNANGENPPALIEAVMRASRRYRDELLDFRSGIGETMPYPFEHAQGDISLSKYILPFIPEPENIGDIMSLGGEAIDRVVMLSKRILGRLAVAGELVETALGLPPLPIEREKKPDNEAAKK